jgi:hypothetical protein
MGIEPTSEAWEASILPLYDARSEPYANKPLCLLQEFFPCIFMLECRVTFVGQALLPVLQHASARVAAMINNAASAMPGRPHGQTRACVPLGGWFGVQGFARIHHEAGKRR